MTPTTHWLSSLWLEFSSGCFLSVHGLASTALNESKTESTRVSSLQSSQALKLNGCPGQAAIGRGCVKTFSSRFGGLNRNKNRAPG